VFSVEKRKMGSIVLARNTSQQHKELIFRAFSYNSGRLETLFLLFMEDFYRARGAAQFLFLAQTSVDMVPRACIPLESRQDTASESERRTRLFMPYMHRPPGYP